MVIGLPAEVFTAAVPWLIIAATLLVALQPLIARRSLARVAPVGASAPASTRPATLGGAVGIAGIYSGYFGAGQGVMLMAVLGWLYDHSVQYANAAKNLLAATANATAAVVFILAGQVWWTAAFLLSIGALVGGTVGARAARRLRPATLRAAVVVIGVLGAIVAWMRL